MSEPKIRIGIRLEGGVVQSVFAPGGAPNIEIVVIDYDTEGAETDELSWVTQDDGSIEEAFVSEWDVADAPLPVCAPVEQSDETCDECGAHLDGPHEMGCPKWDTF